jgi:hypothetical protein
MIKPNTFYRGTQKGIDVTEIGIDEIVYYRSEGSLKYEQIVSGGGGASTSYKGAIVGGLLFGATGALIGSRANETKTEISMGTVTYDDRILMLNILRDYHPYSVSLSLDAEDILAWLIPEKQYNYVIQRRREMYEENPLSKKDYTKA